MNLRAGQDSSSNRSICRNPQIPIMIFTLLLPSFLLCTSQPLSFVILFPFSFSLLPSFTLISNPLNPSFCGFPFPFFSAPLLLHRSPPAISVLASARLSRKARISRLMLLKNSTENRRKLEKNHLKTSLDPMGF